MFLIIFVTIFFTFVLGDPQSLDTCESSIGHVENSTVTGCKFVGGKYILKRGTNVGIHIKFDTDKDVPTVKAHVIGIINGHSIPYPLPNSDGCTVLKCPLNKDDGPFTYIATLPVSHFYPKVIVDVQWELRNENEEVMACVRIPARID